MSEISFSLIESSKCHRRKTPSHDPAQQDDEEESHPISLTEFMCSSFLPNPHNWATEPRDSCTIQGCLWKSVEPVQSSTLDRQSSSVTSTTPREVWTSLRGTKARIGWSSFLWSLSYHFPDWLGSHNHNSSSIFHFLSIWICRRFWSRSLWKKAIIRLIRCEHFQERYAWLGHDC